MLRVLIPIDFSTASINAICYAFDMFKQDTSYDLLHVTCYQDSDTADSFGKELQQEIKQQFDKTLEQIRKQRGSIPPSIHYHSAHGMQIAEVINVYAEKSKADIIIMASTGASDNNHILWGGHTSVMITTSIRPIISVPQHVIFNGIKNIVYATDFSDTNLEGQALVALAKIYGAQIRFLHIFPEVINATNFSPELIAQDLQRSFNYKAITFDAVMSNNPESAIAEFVAEHHPDLLAILSHTRDSTYRVLRKSIINGLAAKVGVPILAFKTDAD
jgi:nucleotide-binding universal stress UspA family protein